MNGTVLLYQVGRRRTHLCTQVPDPESVLPLSGGQAVPEVETGGGGRYEGMPSHMLMVLSLQVPHGDVRHLLFLKRAHSQRVSALQVHVKRGHVVVDASADGSQVSALPPVKEIQHVHLVKLHVLLTTAHHVVLT